VKIFVHHVERLPVKIIRLAAAGENNSFSGRRPIDWLPGNDVQDSLATVHRFAFSDRM
jgi:hypothetical protein